MSGLVAPMIHRVADDSDHPEKTGGDCRMYEKRAPQPDDIEYHGGCAGGTTLLDPTDRALLALLQADCRRTSADLGARVGLSASAANDRVRRLHERGLLLRCAGVVDPRLAGLDVCAFVQVALDRPAAEPGFLAAVRANPAVQEAHHVTGPASYLLKARVRDTAALERFLAWLKTLPGVARTETQLALSSPKETAALDLSDPSEPAASRQPSAASPP